jgi:hypothetical protein
MDHRVIGERSDAVLRTAMPGGDGCKCESRLKAKQLGDFLIFEPVQPRQQFSTLLLRHH